jgi:hypothetical protein
MHDPRASAVAFCLCILLLTRSYAQPSNGPNGEASGKPVALAVTRSSVDGGHLRLDYTIANSSTREIWFCDTMDEDGNDFEAVATKDGQTFIVRKRTDIPWGQIGRNSPLARYLRLRAGKTATEAILLPLPLRTQGVVSDDAIPKAVGPVTRVVLEIGYLEGDIGGTIRNTLEADNRNAPITRYDGTRISPILLIQRINEHRGNSNDEVLFYVNPKHPVVKEERILSVVVDARHLALMERGARKPSAPDLTSCNRLAISYGPSALDYFFPNENQRSLFDLKEMENLRAARDVLVNEGEDVKEFVGQIEAGYHRGITLRRASAHVVCNHDNDRLAAIEMYGDSFVTEAGEPFSRPGPLDDGYGERFRGLASWVRPFQVRVMCSRNLGNLYNRLHLYTEAERSRLVHPPDKSKPEYPASPKWCDSIVDAFRSSGMDDKPFKCPTGGEGKCHYGMNPQCSYDSPGDFVLLFETKAGWNQHGGPELFTFDNHEPKGGLVLLNDGTVKFIRTEEELKQLRWK